MTRRVESVTQPIDPLRATGDGHDVKAAGVGVSPGEKVRRSQRNSALFCRRDRFLGRAEKRIGSKAHLDEDQAFTIAHDQVDFAKFSTVISGDKLKSLRSQIGQRCILARLATGLFLRPWHVSG
jgi:hypothetical protein